MSGRVVGILVNTLVFCRERGFTETENVSVSLSALMYRVKG
jgi:hypothetical protein